MAKAKLSELEGILSDADSEVNKAQKQADDAYYALRIAYSSDSHCWSTRGSHGAAKCWRNTGRRS